MVEMLVAISLILLVLPGTLSIAMKSISLSSYQKDQLIATYLAEEGQELIRSVRDRNVLTIVYEDNNGLPITTTWKAGWSGKNCSIIACKIDFNEDITTGAGNLEDLALNTNDTYRLYLNASGFYSYGAGAGKTATPFYRGVFITPVGGLGDQVTIRSVVVWKTTFGRKKVTSSGFLAYWLR